MSAVILGVGPDWVDQRPPRRRTHRRKPDLQVEPARQRTVTAGSARPRPVAHQPRSWCLERHIPRQSRSISAIVRGDKVSAADAHRLDVVSKRFFTRDEGRWRFLRQPRSFGTSRMNVHKNASMTPRGRAHLVKEIERLGLRPAAEAAGLSLRTARKWQRRFTSQGEPGLLDRSSRPRRTPGLVRHPTSSNGRWAFDRASV
jgi:hypothetical protein